MATDPDKAKKHKVLHTRVTEDLERDLKSKAARLGISVSNLVRNALVHTADLVEGVVADSARVAGSAREFTHPAENAPPGAPTPVIGWQQVTLNLNAICSHCNGILPRGEKAALALPIAADHPRALCLSCLPEPPPAEPAAPVP